MFTAENSQDTTELNLSQKEIIPAKSLYEKGVYQLVDSSPISETIFTMLIGKTTPILSQEEKNNSWHSSKQFEFNGRNSTVTVKMNELSNEKKAYLLENSEYTKKVINALIGMSISRRESKFYPKGAFLSVLGSEILGYMNLLYPSANGKRPRKIESLEGLYRIIDIIKNVWVQSTEFYRKDKTKDSFQVKTTPLLLISCFDTYGQRNLFDNHTSPITDIILTFRPGDWFVYFQSDDKRYLRYNGYLHQHALISTGYTFALLDWLSFRSEQNKEGNYTMETVLNQIGCKESVQELINSYSWDKARKLFEKVSSTLNEIKQITNGYIVYYRNPPEWLNKPTIKKPKGWFKQWLSTVIIIKKPDCLLEGEKPKNPLVIDVKAKSIGEETSPPIDLNTLDTLEARIKETGVSKRSISQYLGKRHDWLSWQLNKGKLTKKDFDNIYNAISFLSKKKN
jgi:hypothetical protein